MMNDFVTESPLSDELLYSQSRFSYAHLDVETRTLAQSRAQEIKILMKLHAENIIQIGLKLLEVKECLGHGQFGKWLAAEFEWSWKTAHNFMNVAVKFVKFTNLESIAPSALYLLAEPSTPDEARTTALERAAHGDRITHKVAKQIVAEVKKTSGGGILKKLLQSKPAQDQEPVEPVEPMEQTQNQEPVRSTDSHGAEPGTNEHREPPLTTPKELSTCNWNKDRGQDRFLQVNLYDQAAGMKLECLAKEYEKLPQTIVELALDALEVLPDREKKITELILKLQDSASETTALKSKVAELEQAIAQKSPEDSTMNRVAELEQTIAQRDSRVAELEQALAQKPQVIYDSNDPRVAELEQTLSQRDSRVTELEEQFATSEYYSTQASLKIEALQKELAQANQLIEHQQPKTLPSGKPQPVPRNSANPAPNLKSLIDFFDVAAEKLQKPSVKISMNDKTIVISRNSTQHPGALNIKAGGVWQGRIEINGNLYKIWEWDEWVMPMLLEFAANPAEMAVKHGRSTGSCCFCNHDLSNERSLATGYGATCAQYYGLQWPHYG